MPENPFAGLIESTSYDLNTKTTAEAAAEQQVADSESRAAVERAMKKGTALIDADTVPVATATRVPKWARTKLKQMAMERGINMSECMERLITAGLREVQNIEEPNSRAKLIPADEVKVILNMNISRRHDRQLENDAAERGMTKQAYVLQLLNQGL